VRAEAGAALFTVRDSVPGYFFYASSVSPTIAALYPTARLLSSLAPLWRTAAHTLRGVLVRVFDRPIRFPYAGPPHAVATHTYTHTRTHTRARAHTHTHTHTLFWLVPCGLVPCTFVDLFMRVGLVDKGARRAPRVCDAATVVGDSAHRHGSCSFAVICVRPMHRCLPCASCWVHGHRNYINGSD
jgi:hypothetical protein